MTGPDYDSFYDSIFSFVWNGICLMRFCAIICSRSDTVFKDLLKHLISCIEFCKTGILSVILTMTDWAKSKL